MDDFYDAQHIPNLSRDTEKNVRATRCSVFSQSRARHSLMSVREICETKFVVLKESVAITLPTNVDLATECLGGRVATIVVKMMKGRSATSGISNTSGTPPRDAAKTVRTTIHRVSVGVLRIELRLVFALGEWTSICGEHIQVFLSRDDLLNLRETSQFHAAREWFGPGWTVILSPLVHILRRPAWDRF